MSRIGIMGGTFNPVHNGHLHIASAAYTQYSLDEIWFMPNHIAAYKSRQSMIRTSDRVAMIQLAIQNIPYFTLNTMEIVRGGKTYTADTLRILHDEHPEHNYYFIIGADSLESFPRWYHPIEILQYAEILVASRGSVDEDKVQALIDETESELHVLDRFHILPCHDASGPRLSTTWVASSRIRECIINGLDTEPMTGQRLSDMLPMSVLQYIYDHNLYA